MNMQLCPTCVPLKYPTGLTQMYPLPQIRSFNQLASFVIIHPACQGSQQSWEHLTCLEKVLHRHGFSLTPLQDSPLYYFIHTDPHLLRLEGQSIHPGAKPPSRENLYIVPCPPCDSGPLAVRCRPRGCGLLTSQCILGESKAFFPYSVNSGGGISNEV